MEQEYETIDLREIFALLKSGWIWIVSATLICATIGGLFTMFWITPQYEASATMIVNTRQDQTATVTNDQITSAKNLVSTYSIIIKSDTVLNQVIQNLQMQTTFEELQKQVTVTAVEATQVMRVAVQDADPAWAKAITAEITKICPDIIMNMVEAGSVKVISESRVGDDPVSPNKMVNVAVSALVGLVLSVGFLFLREMMNNTFQTDSDIQKHLDLPVLGVIPEVSTI